MKFIYIIILSLISLALDAQSPFGSFQNVSSGGGSSTLFIATNNLDKVITNNFFGTFAMDVNGIFTTSNSVASNYFGSGTNLSGVITTNGAQNLYEPVYTPGSGINGITWFPATNVDIVTTAVRTNFVNAQIYTNTTGSLILLVGSTTNVDGGIISTGANTFTIAVSNAGYLTWSDYNTGGNVVATSIAGLLETNTFCVPVDTNGVYMLYTTASGSGNLSGIIPGTGQIVIIGNATASGVPSLGGNNTFTGIQTFSTINGTLFLTSPIASNTITSSNSALTLPYTPTSMPTPWQFSCSNSVSNVFGWGVQEITTQTASSTLLWTNPLPISIGNGSNLEYVVTLSKLSVNTSTGKENLSSTTNLVFVFTNAPSVGGTGVLYGSTARWGSLQGSTANGVLSFNSYINSTGMAIYITPDMNQNTSESVYIDYHWTY